LMLPIYCFDIIIAAKTNFDLVLVSKTLFARMNIGCDCSVR
jgi:hypothetical protein